MEIRFPRLPDGTRAYSVVTRSDGVRYRIWEGVAGPDLPHDLVHLTVERVLGEDGGFWGAVAAGAVFDSMQHLSGRRPPHVAARSATAIRARADRLQRAELMADLVQRVVAGSLGTPEQVRAAARDVLSTLPDPTVDVPAVLAAADELRSAARRWAALVPGEELVVTWPEPAARRGGAGRSPGSAGTQTAARRRPPGRT